MRHGWLIALAMAGTFAAGGCQREHAGGEGRAGAALPAAMVADRGVAPATRAPGAERQQPQLLAGGSTDALRQEAEHRYQQETSDIVAAFKSDEARCEAYPGEQRVACLAQARNDYERKLREARLRLDGTQRGPDAASAGRAPRLYC